jgi:hypothetical protein
MYLVGGFGAPRGGHHGSLVGLRVSPSTVSDLNKKIYATIEAWRNRAIEDEHPYVHLDGIVLKRSWCLPGAPTIGNTSEWPETKAGLKL